MTTARTGEPTQKPLRLWPGVVLAVLLCLTRFVLPIVVPDALIVGIVGSLVGALAIVLWWTFFSRAPIIERWSAILLMIVAIAATSRILDKSVAGGMMGLMFPMYAIPALCVVFVVWAVATSRLSNGLRRATMVATILLGSGAWALLRTNGISGEASSDLRWRWAQSAEERLLAHASDNLPAIQPAPAAVKAPDEPPAIPPTPAAAKTHVEPVVARAASESTVRDPASTAAGPKADWPGFRGPHRDGNIPGVRIETDWSASPPVQMWRRPIGPGWSSFAVHGDLLYTQEQRGNDEVIACYKVSTGEPVWMHRDPARFWESNGGAGPRATPTLSNGRVYTFGATGILNALDARSGAVVWSRNVASDADKKIPGWGFASSPLVIDDEIIVAASGKLAAFDLATGTPRWLGPNGGASYSSPHPMTIDGVFQVVLLSGNGAVSVAPADGKVLWEYKWPSDTRIVQPAMASDGDLLMSVGEAMGGGGMRRIAVANAPGGWTVQERWTSNGLKPNFNDFVVHNGYVFGFDGNILSCIDLKDGKRKWKGGRYGSGQLVLLPDQDLLLVSSEEGELALVSATPDQFKELAKFKAIEGKTWNHPVLVGDVLLVRNGEEMAAFRLSLAHL